MAKIQLEFNLEDVKSTFEPLPEDQYVCKIAKADLVNAKSSGKPMVSLMMEVLEGPEAGRKIFDNMPLHVDWKVKQYAEACGITKGTDLDTELFLNQEVIVELGIDKEDDTRNRVNKVRALSE